LKQDKLTSKSSVRILKAAAGHILPVFYKGSIIRIGETEAVEIDWNLLEFESKHQLEKALAQKNIIEIGEY
jgi:hypothetical protein